MFLAGERVDMLQVASRAGVHRATLYRRVGNRDDLVGELLWFYTRAIYHVVLDRTDHLKGAARIVALTSDFLSTVARQKPLKDLLANEPEFGMKVLTNGQGRVQPRTVEVTTQVIEAEIATGAYSSTIPAHLLAYAIVRLGESFLYADVIANQEPDIGLAIELVSRIVGP